MSTTINFNSYINGLATDVTSVELESSDATYGLKRIDTQASVQAPGTDVPRIATGQYQLVFADPDPDLTYDYAIKVVYSGSTYYYPRVAAGGATLNHIYTIPTQSYYSSEAEVMRLLGERSIAMMMEDWESTDKSAVWNQLLQTVDANIDQFITQHYRRSAVISNTWVRTNATFMTAHLLSLRRGNPGVYLRANEEAYERLNDIRNGRLHIPGAAPLGRQAPVVRNYRMQNFMHHPVRVIESKSTGAVYEGTSYAFEPFFYMW
jgi:hypothetical protein